jgi:hypothetical protein
MMAQQPRSAEFVLCVPLKDDTDPNEMHLFFVCPLYEPLKDHTHGCCFGSRAYRQFYIAHEQVSEVDDLFRTFLTQGDLNFGHS